MTSLFDTVTTLTFLMLGSAAAVFVLQIVRLKRAGHEMTQSFPTYLLVMIVGWLGTEIVADYGKAYAQAGQLAHLFVMGAFAVIITIHLRSSLKSP